MYVMLVVIAMITAGTIIILMMRGNEERELTRTIKEHINLIRTTVNSRSLDDDIDVVMQSFYKSSAPSVNNKKILILDNNAKVIYPKDSVEHNTRLTTHQIIGAIEDGYFDDPDISVTLEGDDKEYIGIAENIKVNGSIKYIVYGLADYSSVETKVSSIVKIILIAILAALLIALIVSFIFASFITKPILEITDSAIHLADGTLSEYIEVHSNDEIGQLTMTFNNMAQSLKNTLNEIMTEKNKLETVFEHMTDGILVFDKNGKLIHYNESSSYMVNTNKKADFFEVIGNSLNETYESIKTLVEDGTVFRPLEEYDKFFSLYFAKYKEKIGDELGVMCVIQDVTESKRIENLQKEFVANVSHELRTPITTIKTYSETLIDSFEHSDEAVLNFLLTINRESDRMTKIVTDLLALAKLDNNKDILEIVEADLVTIVENVYDSFLLIAKNTNKTINFNKPEGSYIVNVDIPKIEQVIKNIVSNAVKYTDDDGIIDISFRSDEKKYFVDIVDNGFGIPKDDLPRIFERFYRVDKTRSRAMGGTGLGLSIAKQLMKNQGGDITVKSYRQQGSVFTLVFPKANESGE